MAARFLSLIVCFAGRCILSQLPQRMIRTLCMVCSTKQDYGVRTLLGRHHERRRALYV